MSDIPIYLLVSSNQEIKEKDNSLDDIIRKKFYYQFKYNEELNIYKYIPLNFNRTTSK